LIFKKICVKLPKEFSPKETSGIPAPNDQSFLIPVNVSLISLSIVLIIIFMVMIIKKEGKGVEQRDY